MGIQLDAPRLLTEHADTATQALLAGDGELEIIEPRQAAIATGIAQQCQAAQGDITIEQLDIQLRAVALDQSQSAFANTVAAPEPGGDGGTQQQQGQIGQAQHDNSSGNPASLTDSVDRAQPGLR